VLVIIGLLLGGVLKGQELITSARVRNLISQQDGIKAAYFGFQDRFRALPGDYSQAVANIGVAANAACGGGNGNGNGQITPGGVNLNEDILVWEHLSRAGFLTGTYTCKAPPSDTTSNPTNPYGVVLQLAFDGVYGITSGGVPRHNLKTGNQIPVDIMAEVDRKVDDGLPYTGAFQFSNYGPGGNNPTEGNPAAPACTSGNTAAAVWNTPNGSANCGGASVF